MLKRIHIEQLRLGMHVHELPGSWMDHPFWRKAFLLDDPKAMQTILSLGIMEVWIDTARGLDVEHVPDQEDEVTEADIIAEVDASLMLADPPVDSGPGIDTAQEAGPALLICAKSKQAVKSMFQEARMGKSLDAKDALSVVEEISASVMRNPGALIGLARMKSKDQYTYMHSVAVCALMISLARTLGLGDEQIRQAGMAGLLHDVGKMMMPLEVLNKPGKLTDEEFSLIKNHPVEGHKMLQAGIGISETVLDVCLHHHEKVDGRGYPDRLGNEQISVYAKMGAVCDVYDAVTSDRPYKDGWEPAEAIRKMAEWTGHFDQVVFHAFVKSIGIYPVGSLVRLESDRLGVIVEQTAASLLTPIVKVFFSIKSNARIAPEILDLSKPACKDKIVSSEAPAKWGMSDLAALWSDLPATSW